VRRIGKDLIDFRSKRMAEPPLPSASVALNHERGVIEVTEPIYDTSLDAAWQEYQVVLTNSAVTARTVRLNLRNVGTWPVNFIGNTLLITGGSCQVTDDPVDLRDQSILTTGGQDLGIPVQMGKNFHWTSSDDNPDRFRGHWIDRYVLVRIPPGSTERLRFVQNYQWCGGKIPAVAHGHLCTVGFNKKAGYAYGSATDQQWDEATIGASGESITFGHGNDGGRTFANDVRDALSPIGDYGGNVGGLGLVNYIGSDGKAHNTIQERTSWIEGGPHRTEVTYGRIADDRSFALRATMSLSRTDDLLRLRMRLRYDIRSPMAFRQFAFLQIGTNSYNYAIFDTIVRGDGGSEVEAWPALTIQPRSDITSGILPWFSLHGVSSWPNWVGASKKPGEVKYSMENARSSRGVIIRSWHGRLNGAVIARPSFRTVSQRDYSKVASVGTLGYRPSAILELSPPAGVSAFQAGDWLQAEIDVIVVPTEIRGVKWIDKDGAHPRNFAYAGPNSEFSAALDLGRDTSKMVSREATGNQVFVTGLNGTTVQGTTMTSPDGRNASFTMTGGLAWVPITITGLSSYHHAGLQIQDGTAWSPVLESGASQSRFNPVSRTWSISMVIHRDAFAPLSVQNYRLAQQVSLGLSPVILVPASSAPERLITKP